METRMKFVKMTKDDLTLPLYELQKRLISLKRRGRKAQLALYHGQITEDQYTNHIEALRAFALDISKTRGWPKLPI